VDADGHIQLPEQFKDDAPFILTKGLDGCLMLAPEAYFRSLSEKVRRLALTDRRSRTFRRHLFALAVQVKPDERNRIPVPSHLRDYANLGDTAVVVGNDAYLEIWDVGAWQRMLSEMDHMVQQDDWEIEGI
jgi:MraZ protein